MDGKEPGKMQKQILQAVVSENGVGFDGTEVADAGR